MPSSNLVLAPTVLAMAAEVRPRRVLDVGPGHGKYGLLCREYLPRLELLEAVEAEARYVEAFPWLSAIYDGVVVDDVARWPAANYVTERGRAGNGYFDRYDLVLMLDVLEHLDTDAAGAVLAAIPGRVIVCTPRDFFQNPEADEGWPTERHRSHWTAAGIAEAAGRPLEVEDVNAWNIGGILVRIGPVP